MELSQIICNEAVIPQLKATERDKVIEELVTALGHHLGFDSAKVKQLVKLAVKREKEASTGIGKGVAVPHVKDDMVKEPMAAVGCSQEGVDFSSLDKQPVYSVILLLSPSSEPDRHLQAMEAIFKNLQKDDFRRFLRQAQTHEAILEAIRDAEEDSR